LARPGHSRGYLSYIRLRSQGQASRNCCCSSANLAKPTVKTGCSLQRLQSPRHLRPNCLRGGLSMDEIIVRCPFCVLDNGFRPMLSTTSGCYGCTSCGHLAIPDDHNFQCPCGRCTGLRARVASAPPPQFWRTQEKPTSSPRLLSVESSDGFAHRSKLA
jgi:hypothetical protein